MVRDRKVDSIFAYYLARVQRLIDVRSFSRAQNYSDRVSTSVKYPAPVVTDSFQIDVPTENGSDKSTSSHPPRKIVLFLLSEVLEPQYNFLLFLGHVDRSRASATRTTWAAGNRVFDPQRSRGLSEILTHSADLLNLPLPIFTNFYESFRSAVRMRPMSS